MHSAPLHGKQRYGGGCGGRHRGHRGLGGDGGGAAWCSGQLVQSMVVCCIVLHQGGGGGRDHWCVVLVHHPLLVCINWFRIQSFNS